MKSSWSFTMGSSGDAVYDVWFGNSATPTVPQVELMIWIGNKDKMPLGYGSARCRFQRADAVRRHQWNG